MIFPQFPAVFPRVDSLTESVWPMAEHRTWPQGTVQRWP